MDSKRDIRNKRWLSRWERMRRRGILRYSLVYGIIYCLLSFGLIWSIINLFSNLFPQIEERLSDSWTINLLLAMCIGISLSILQYAWNEIRFRRLGSKYPSACSLR